MEIERYAGVLVKYKNKVLLCKRNKEKSFPGLWSIPGGKMEEDETTKNCAKREFFEETNINIDNNELRFIGTIPWYSKDKKLIKGFMYVYLLESENQINPDLDTAVDGFEHTDCGYFTIKEIDLLEIGENLYNLIKIILQ